MKEKKTSKVHNDPNVYPPGWNYARAKSIADHYDNRKGQAVLDNPIVGNTSVQLVWMEVPEELVPQVRKLIARRRKIA